MSDARERNPHAMGDLERVAFERDLNAPYPRWVHSVDPNAMLREVWHQLYVGGAGAILAGPSPTRGWSAAIDCQGPKRLDGREERYGALVAMGRPVLRWPFDDAGPIPAGMLDAALAVAAAAPGDVLVSCSAGASRSAGVAAALLCAMHGVSLDHALTKASLVGRGNGPHPAVVESVRAWVEARERAGEGP